MAYNEARSGAKATADGMIRSRFAEPRSFKTCTQFVGEYLQLQFGLVRKRR